MAASSVIVAVTPAALGKPWLIWEAGACHGAAIAGATGGRTPSDAARPLRLLVTMAFGLAETECPDPLRAGQIVAGSNRDRVGRLFESVLDSELPDLPKDEQRKVGGRMPGVLDRFLQTVTGELRRMPSLVNEANVQDWLSRLSELEQGDRTSEIAGFERWMMLAFERPDDAIDVRLHRRLGELHLGRRDYARAVTQLDLARRAAPRDIYVLRPLGQAYMNHYMALDATAPEAERDGIKSKVHDVLAAIAELDPDAYRKTPEAAALRARFERRAMANPNGAAAIYQEALQHNPDSYYLADVCGQTWLELKEFEKAREVYQRAVEIIDRVKEVNVWTCATAATANLVLGQGDRTRENLAKLKSLGARPSELAAIARGLREVAGQLRLSDTDVNDLLRLIEEPS